MVNIKKLLTASKLEIFCIQGIFSLGECILGRC